MTLPPVTGCLYFTELFNTFAPNIKRRITADLDGLGETTRNKYMQYGIIPLLKFAKKEKRNLSINTLLDFSVELQLKGKGAGTISSAYNGLKILMSAFGFTLEWKEKNAYLARFTRHKQAFDSRQSRKWPYPFKLDDVLFLANKPPPNCSTTTWSRFVFIGWTFLLRKSEIFRVSPTDLSCVRDKSGKLLEVSLSIRNNKNSKNKKEARKVSFPASLIPSKILQSINKICKEKNWDWGDLPHENIILPHLKECMIGRYDHSYYYIVIHSLRHGRSDNLQVVYKVNDERMLQYGRWSTTSGRNAYKHA